MFPESAHLDLCKQNILLTDLKVVVFVHFEGKELEDESGRLSPAPPETVSEVTEVKPVHLSGFL